MNVSFQIILKNEIRSQGRGIFRGLFYIINGKDVVGRLFVGKGKFAVEKGGSDVPENQRHFKMFYAKDLVQAKAEAAKYFN